MGVVYPGSQGHTVCMGKCPKWWLLSKFILQGKLTACLKILRLFGIVQYIEK